MANLIERLEGPVLVVGGTGFIGSHLVKYLQSARKDVFGIGSAGCPFYAVRMGAYKTIFNCAAYGLRVGQNVASEMLKTNVSLVEGLLGQLQRGIPFTYIHAGSSSEYGAAVMAPLEESPLHPVTPYGVTKASASMLIYYYGKALRCRTANLRLYNVYGPGDHDNSLMSAVIAAGKKGYYPPFKNAATCRDFVHVDDVCRAFVAAAVNLKEEHYGEAFNIGGDVRTLGEVAANARKIFKIQKEPSFDSRSPLQRWCSNPHKAEQHLGFKSEISLAAGMKRLARGK